MEFRVSAVSVEHDSTTPPEFLQLPAITPLGSADAHRDLSLNEEVYDDGQGFEGPSAALLGTVIENGEDEGQPLLWSDLITENPALGATEEWDIYNFTEDAHPIHIHQVQFVVVGREA